MNVVWCRFNVLIRGATPAVAREMRQLRTTVRIAMVTPVMARLPDGTLVAGETIDMSSGGTSIRFQDPIQVAPKTELHLAFPIPSGTHELHRSPVSSRRTLLPVRFGQ